MSTSPRLGWIGLGSMGLPMATNLQTHLSSHSLPNLTYHNRTLSRGDPLKSLSATPAPDIPALLSETDIIFLSLSDDNALESTITAILFSSDISGKLVVDTSTVHPNSSAKAAERLKEKGAHFVAAPVFGASPVAAKGQLVWVIAGAAEQIARFEMLIEGVMGRAVLKLGQDVREASLLKTAGNFLTAGMMELISETTVLTQKASLPSHALPTLLALQYGPLAASMSDRLTSGAYMPPCNERPWSDLNLAIKDVGHGVRVAEESGCRLHVGEVALDHLKEAKKIGDEKGRSLDSSSLYGVLRMEAGLDFESEVVKKRDEELAVKE